MFPICQKSIILCRIIYVILFVLIFYFYFLIFTISEQMQGRVGEQPPVMEEPPKGGIF